MSEYGAEVLKTQNLFADDFHARPLAIKLTTTGKIQADWPSKIVLNSTAARNCDMPAPTATPTVADKLWFIYNNSTATLTIRTDTGGTIIALTTVRRGAMIMALGGVWKLFLKSAT